LFCHFIPGTGELFLWGKNAGLIHSDKPSQYFQYIPHHIQMDGLFVMQVRCKSLAPLLEAQGDFSYT
jgi:hypothetical protein